MNQLIRTLLLSLLAIAFTLAFLPIASAQPAEPPPEGSEAEETGETKVEEEKAAESPAPAPPVEKPPVELDEPFVDPTAGMDEPFVDPLAGQAAPATPEQGTIDLPEVDELKLTIGGLIQSDIRFQAAPKSTGVFYDRSDFTFYERDDIPTGMRRNENIFKLKLDAGYGRFAGAVDVDFVWLGYPGDIEGIGDLTLRDRTDPYYLQVHAAYVEATDVILDGLDLRIGQQLVQWGMADQFNPTNNLNPSDVEDVIMFGEQRANMMARFDYNPWESLEISGVLVPVFKPALLPKSAPLGLAMTDRMPMQSSSVRYRLATEQGFTSMAKENALFAGTHFPTTVARVIPELPKTSFGNMQFAFRVAFSLVEQDFAFSYYKGRHDIPQAISNHTVQELNPFCNPDDDTDCLDGLLGTVATVAYPEMQVVGFNMAGEIPLWGTLGGIGYRFEFGLYFPEQVRIALTSEEIDMGLVVNPAGEYDYDGDGEPGGPRPIVVDDEAFAKWTLGLDYSFGPHAMLILMWVHGMPDEFGGGADFYHGGNVVRDGEIGFAGYDTQADWEYCFLDREIGGLLEECSMGNQARRSVKETLRPRIADYLVLGMDFKFDDDKALLRLFTVWDLSGYYEDYWDEQLGDRARKWYGLFTKKGFSAIVLPEFTYNFGKGFELTAGALLQFGKIYTKFGDPAASGTFVYGRARYSF